MVFCPFLDLSDVLGGRLEGGCAGERKRCEGRGTRDETANHSHAKNRTTAAPPTRNPNRRQGRLHLERQPTANENHENFRFSIFHSTEADMHIYRHTQTNAEKRQEHFHCTAFYSFSFFPAFLLGQNGWQLDGTEDAFGTGTLLQFCLKGQEKLCACSLPPCPENGKRKKSRKKERLEKANAKAKCIGWMRIFRRG